MVGALLGAIWFWPVLMTPIAIAVVVGIVVSLLRSTRSSPTHPLN